MSLLSCPKEEILLQYLSIPNDMRLIERMGIKLHLKSCKPCLDKSFQIQDKLTSYFTPESDITSSLLSVYSKLKQDETLILKGWKLDEIAPQQASQKRSVRNWLFRGSVAVGFGCMGILFLLADQTSVDSTKVASRTDSNVPFAQVRYQNKNRVHVQYLRPELVQSVEFETTGR